MNFAKSFTVELLPLQTSNPVSFQVPLIRMKASVRRAMALPFAAAKFDSSSYAAYRPSYGPALYKQLYAYHKGDHDLALDIGCGTGQITAMIAPEFKKIYGVDTSAKMLEAATKAGNIEYVVGNAEDLPELHDSSVDLIAVGQAAHWFNHEAWFKEMYRILKPNGTLSYWSYVRPLDSILLPPWSLRLQSS